MRIPLPLKARLCAELSGFTTAARMLSIVPLPGGHKIAFEFCHPWFPVIGAGIGGLVALAGGVALAGTGGWNEVAALAMLASGAVFTRGLHLDGLSDWADGFWGGFTREKRLAIMKDSRLGAFGGVALALILLGKWIAYTRIAADGNWSLPVTACVLSRAMQVLLAHMHPYARREGGTGRLFVDGASGGRTAITLLVAFALLAPMLNAGGGLPAAAAGALLLTLLFGRSCRRSFGGVTGDLLGANSEIVELWVLLCGGLWTA